MADYQGKRFKKTQPDNSARPTAARGAHARGANAGHAASATSGARAAGTTPGAHAARATGATRGAHSAPAAGARRTTTGGTRFRTASSSAPAGVVPPRSAASTSASGARYRQAAPAPAKQRPARRRSILPKLLIALGVILLLVAGFIFVRSLLGYRQAEETYGSLAEYAPVDDSSSSGLPVVDFDALAEINPDIVAWIYVPNTNINYPVVQGDDNSEYLYRLFDGTSNSSGSIFLDADATAPGIVDEQTPVYGHHMNNRSMFYEIDDTVDQAAFDKIEAVYYITRDATYRCTPLMTCVIDETFVDARQANFSDTHSLADYLREMRADMRAEADDAEERIATVDQVLTLITCSGELPGADRTVMVLSVDEQAPSLAVASQG